MAKPITRRSFFALTTKAAAGAMLYQPAGLRASPTSQLRLAQIGVDAILGNGGAKATTQFDYSGPLSETVLLGLVANRFPGKKLEWDAANGRFTNKPEADAYLTKEYRRGHEVPGVL